MGDTVWFGDIWAGWRGGGFKEARCHIQPNSGRVGTARSRLQVLLRQRCEDNTADGTAVEAPRGNTAEGVEFLLRKRRVRGREEQLLCSSNTVHTSERPVSGELHEQVRIRQRDARCTKVSGRAPAVSAWFNGIDHIKDGPWTNSSGESGRRISTAQTSVTHKDGFSSISEEW